MQTFNWFFGLDDESAAKDKDGKPVPLEAQHLVEPSAQILEAEIESNTVPEAHPPARPATMTSEIVTAVHVVTPELLEGKPAAAAPPLEHLAVTSETPVASIAAASAKLAPPQLPSLATDSGMVLNSATMHAYAPPDLQRKPTAMPSGNDVVVPPAAVLATPDVKPKRALLQLPAGRVRTVILAAATTLVVIAVAMSLLSGPSKNARSRGTAAALATAPTQPAIATPMREDPAVACLQDSSQYQSSAERDQLLLEAIAEFDRGRLEGAHSLFKKYSTLSCDRATLEAAAILERQTDAKSRDR